MIKAQVNLEFVVAILIIILIFLGFYAFYLEEKPKIEDSQFRLKLRDECFRISNAIQSAIVLGDGYTAQLTTDYNIKIEEGTIFVNSNNETVACTYRGSLLSTSFTDSVNITNRNNEVLVEDA